MPNSPGSCEGAATNPDEEAGEDRKKLAVRAAECSPSNPIAPVPGRAFDFCWNIRQRGRLAAKKLSEAAPK